jgi:hypothetical protein
MQQFIFVTRTSIQNPLYPEPRTCHIEVDRKIVYSYMGYRMISRTFDRQWISTAASRTCSMSSSPTMRLSYLHFFVIYLKKISKEILLEPKVLKTDTFCVPIPNWIFLENYNDFLFSTFRCLQTSPVIELRQSILFSPSSPTEHW